MLDGVVIRRAVPDDYSTIVDLWRAAGGFCDRCCHPAARYRWPKILAHVTETCSTHVATMDVDGTEVIVGFAVMEPPVRATHRPILHAIYVREQCRREGIGRGLWDAAQLTTPMFATHMASGWSKILREHRLDVILDASLFWRHQDAAIPPEASSQGRSNAAHSDRTASP